ncbi:MAG TPA: DNA-binding protein [Bacteroidetes bacterium]|nr:DNA-binding protein [Bacteroidota bacterium]
MKRKAKREHFEHFTIAGFTYYDGALAFSKLRVGTRLKLVAEPKNQFDKNAVVLYLKKYKLGYIPRAHNREISKVLNAGYPIFSAYVQMVNPQKNPEEQVQVIVFIEKNRDAKS